jgi:hypothetical protein
MGDLCQGATGYPVPAVECPVQRWVVQKVLLEVLPNDLDALPPAVDESPAAVNAATVLLHPGLIVLIVSACQKEGCIAMTKKEL